MRLRRPIAFILSAVVAASALTGCDSFSGHAAAAANSAQVQQLIEFIADLGLERDLRQALQKGGDLRQALLTLLGLESAVNFNVDDLAGARPGQHAVQVWEVTAQSAEDAAALAASQIRAVLEQLKSSGVTEGRIGMVEVNGKYYVVVDVEVTEENTFEPIRPTSDDDDDSDDDNEDTPSVSAPTVTMNGGMTIDLSELDGSEITADDILKLAKERTGTEYQKSDITTLDLSGCTGLQSIGNSSDFLMSGAFAGCEKLTTVILPSSVTTIGPYAFHGCNSLTSIDLSACKNLATIHIGAFQNCANLETITLPAGLITIHNSAFQSCTNLASINLSGCTNLQRIGHDAFANSGLTSITLPASLTTIDFSAFSGCSNLTKIDLSNTKVNTIGDHAFFECTNLETVLLPANLTTIGSYAFQNCSGLKTVKLPASLTTIGGWAFLNCSSLENITFYTVPDTIEMFAFSGVISDNDPSDKLTIYCPSSCDIDELKIQLKNGGLAEGTYTLDDTLNPAAYLLSL